MDIAPRLKLLFALLLLPMLVLCSAVGITSGVGYYLIASLMTIAGAICLASALPKSSNSYLVGLAYFVVVEFVVFALP